MQSFWCSELCFRSAALALLKQLSGNITVPIQLMRLYNGESTSSSSSCTSSFCTSSSSILNRPASKAFSRRSRSKLFKSMSRSSSRNRSSVSSSSYWYSASMRRRRKWGSWRPPTNELHFPVLLLYYFKQISFATRTKQEPENLKKPEITWPDLALAKAGLCQNSGLAHAEDPGSRYHPPCLVSCPLWANRKLSMD